MLHVLYMADPGTSFSNAHVIRVPPHTPLFTRFCRWLKRNGVAICISVMSAAFTGWQGYEAHQTRLDAKRLAEVARKDAKDAAEQARKEAKEASDRQLEDVRAAKRAAEESATAARELANGMNRSARAAEASAEAGKESVQISKRALLLSERPTLESISAKLTAQLRAGQLAEITVDTINTGKGPAYNVSVEQWVSIAPRLAFSFDGKKVVRADLIGVGSTAGRSKLGVISEIPISEVNFKEITSQRSLLFVYGLVAFEERTFDGAIKQAYTYCYQYEDNLALRLCRTSPPIPRFAADTAH